MSRRRWRTVPGMCVLAGGILTVGGCAGAGGSVRGEELRFEPGPAFTSEEELAASFGGSVRSVHITESDGGSSRVIVSFDERADKPRFASLNDFAASVDGRFRGAFPDRTLSILAVEGTDRLVEAGYPFVVLAYGQTPPADGERWSSICDAAALLIETPEGYWTLSWNAARGTLDDSRSTLASFLEGMVLADR